jgi:hypothetical protein
VISIEIDPTPFLERTKELRANADQLPFVLSRLLNNAAFNARRVLVETTWPSHVRVFNKAFIGAALRVDTSTKTNLVIRIYDTLRNRAHLLEHAKGGTERPFKARRFAIPISDRVRKGAHGIVQRDKPASIIERTPKRALRITQTGIFVGEAGRLHLIYSLKPQTMQPPDVPFYDDFNYVMTNDMRTGFDEAMIAAMRTRR